MSNVNSEFQQLDIVRDFEPSLELVDGIVADLLANHGKVDEGETPWMLPLAALRHACPDALPHAKIEQRDAGWRLTTIQRALGKGALNKSYHLGTKVSRCQRTRDNLFIDEFTFFRDGYRPRVSVFSDHDEGGEYAQELFKYLFDKVFVPKGDILQVAKRPVIEHDRNLLQKGCLWMRRKERRYLGYSPDLGDY